MTYHEPLSNDEKALAAQERAGVMARGRRLRRRRTGVLASSVAAVVGVSVGLVAALDHGTRDSSVRVITPTTVPASTTTTTKASTQVLGSLPPGRSTASVPVVVCPTSLPYTSPTTATEPKSTPLVLPPSLIRSVAVYTDNLARMRIVAPRGWSCSALYGQDGSGDVAVYPPGATLPFDPNYAFHSVPRSSRLEGVFGGTSGACAGCTLVQACPLFAQARQEYQAQFGGDGCAKPAKPSEETTDQISNGVVAFRDPPGVSGTGSPSGGAYPATGVMTFYSGSNLGSRVETCTLPPKDAPLCTLSLDQFVAAYGQS